MQSKILKIKRSIQALTICLGIILFILSIFMFVGAYFYICFGVAVFFASLYFITVGILKIVCYNIMLEAPKKQTNTQPAATTKTATRTENAVEDLHKKIMHLQKMKNDGLITDPEYNKLKSDLINNCGGRM